MKKTIVIVLLATAFSGCTGPEGRPGAQGAAGLSGKEGQGTAGEAGPPGADGQTGQNGQNGVSGLDGRNGVSFKGDPLSSLVAITVSRQYPELATAGFAGFVKTRVNQVANGSLPAGVEFPLKQAGTDQLRLVDGLQANVVASWLDPLTFKTFNASTGEPIKSAARFGANTDFTAFFGDGWNSTPYFNGSDVAGYIWTNHEYVSGLLPEIGAKPFGQMMTLAKYLVSTGELTIDVENDSAWDQLAVNIFLEAYKKQMGASFMRVIQDPGTGEWQVDLASTKNTRYDATSNTRLKLNGTVNATALATFIQDHSDSNTAALLPAGVIAGTLANCSGGVTPWGTIISAEENSQDYYGDPEPWWDGSNQLVPAKGADAGAAIAQPNDTAAGSEFDMHSFDGHKHSRRNYGWLAEIEPGVNPSEHYGKTTAGVGHAKLGALGRARWENAAIAMDTSWHPVNGQKLVAYYGDDRRNGRVYKFVSDFAYYTTATTAYKRSLLENGKVYVGNFSGIRNTDGYTVSVTTGNPKGDFTYDNSTGVVTPTFAAGGIADLKPGYLLRDFSTAKSIEILSVGASTFKIATGKSADFNGGGFWIDRGPTAADPRTGTWIELSLANTTQDAPNAAAVAAGTKVGAALASNTYNGLGGFAAQFDVLSALHTASGKIGVFELNRPEDVEWNPGDSLLYVALTNHTGRPSLNGSGVVTANVASRTDTVGRIWAVEEANTADPAASTSFTFWEVWNGYKSSSDHFAAANPDNIMIDGDFDVWFGTDGNFGTSGGYSDAIYFLDQEPAHAGTTHGKAFRVAGTPSDAEATGPALSPGMGTLFFGVQHPGESNHSSWPQR